MVAIVTGAGVGIERSSASVLGARGQIGSATVGRGGDNAFLNAATGNLVITRQDEFLIGVGPDISIGRTYNSQALIHDGDNGDNWRASAYRRIVGTPGAGAVTRVDWDGTETVFTLAAGSSNLYKTTDGSGAPDEVWWVSSTSQWMFRDTNSRIRDYYDSSGKLLTTTDLDFNTLTYAYVGNLISSVTDQNGERTDFVYGGTGGTQLLKITTQAPTGSVRVHYGYDGLNRLETVTVDLSPDDGSITDGDKYVTTYGYDGTSKRVASILQSDGSFLEIAYTANGGEYRVTSLTETVAADITRVTGIFYDLAARTTRITDPLGLVTTIGYDSKGNLTRVASGSAQAQTPTSITTYEYSATGDVLSMTENGRRTDYQYDSLGNQTLSRDAAGNTITRTYGLRNEVVTSTLYLAPDLDGAGTAAAAGTPVTTRYAHDGENHRRFAVSAEGDVVEYIYNAPGQLVSTIEYTTHKYDVSALAPNAALTEATLAAWAGAIGDKSSVRRTDTTYDFRGNVRTVTRYSAADAAGNGLLAADYSRDTYFYDQAGQLLSRLNSASSALETFSYDGLGRLEFTSDMANASTTFLFAENASTTTTTTATLASGLVRVAAYNKAGELISVTESGTGVPTGVTNYYYDGLGRLRMQTSPTGRATYHLYDNANRKAADITADGSMTEYAYDADNRLVKTVGYINKLSAAQIALLDDFTAGGAGGTNTGGIGTLGASGPTSLLTNGGFETSGSYATTTWGRSNPTLPGWTKIAGEAFEQVDTGFGGVNATEGLYWLDLDSSPNPTLVPIGSNVLVNGSFDSWSSGSTVTGFGRADPALPGWVKAGGAIYEQVLSGFGGVNATNGAYWLDLDSTPSTTFLATGENLLTNGGFETSGAFTQLTGGRSNTTLPGWTKANAETFEQVNSNTSGVTAAEGGYWLDMESVPGPLAPSGPNLIVNGSFEQSGSGAYTQVNPESWQLVINPNGMPGWSGMNYPTFEQNPSGEGTVNASDGAYWLDMESNSGGAPFFAEQVISSLTAGQAYQLKFDHANRPTAAGETFGVYWNDILIATIGAAGATMVTETFQVTAKSGTNRLMFGSIGTVNGKGPSLDNVRLFAMTPNGGGGNMDISQTVSGRTAGEVMKLQFSHANRTTAASGSFEVWWNNALVATVTDTGTAMLEKSYDVTAIAGTNTLRFKSLGTVDTVGASLDNVRLFATVPGPPGGNMDISQTVSVAAAGTMQLQFDHANRTTAASGSFDVYWNGSLVAQISSTGTTMLTKTYQVSAAAGNNTLRFVGTGTADGNGASIDNVRLFAMGVDPNSSNMNISQTVGGLTAGQSLLLQFDHANRTSPASGSFEVYWNDQIVATVAESGTAMQSKSYNVTATAGNNALRFKSTGTGDSTGASLDNVRLFVASGSDALAGLRPGAHDDDRYQWNVYDSASRLIETIDGTGAATVFAYDGASRLISTTAFANRLAVGTVAGYKVAGPTVLALPTPDPDKDRVARNFHDKEGLLVGTLDGEGYLTENVYDAADLLIETIRYATVTAAANRATGSFATLKAGVTATANAKDVHNWYVYDGRGLLRGLIDGEGDLTRYHYTAAGDVDQEVRGQKLSPAALMAARPTFAGLPTADGGQVVETVNYTRDAMGRMLTESRLLSNGGGTWTTSYAYDSVGRLTSRTEAAGTADARTLTQRYDARGNLIGELRGEGSVALAALGANPAATAVDNVYATWGIVYAYDAAGRLVSRTEANGTDAAGNRTAYYYRGELLAFQVNARGEVIEYRYNARGERTDTILYANRVGAATMPAVVGGEVTGDVQAVANSLVDAVFDSIAHVDYDVTGRVRQSVDAVSNTVTYGYNAFGELKTRIDPLEGAITVQTDRLYDRRGLLVSEKRDTAAGGLQLETLFGYDAFGRPSQVTDAAGRVRKTDYDRAGRVAVTTDARNATQSFDYDGRGNVISIIDRNNATTTFTYDAFSRTVTSTTPGAITTTIKHDAHGQTISIKDGALRETVYHYDKDGNLKSETDAASNQVTHAYDAAGRRKETVDARGSKTSYTYDAVNRLLTEEVDDGGLNLLTAYEYDAKGQQIKITDPALRVTEVKFDRAGRKTAVIVDTGTGGLALRTEYAYDKSGRLLRVTEAAANTALARLTQYEYDKADRLQRTRVDPDGLNLLTQYSYDKAGNVARTTDAAGFVTTFAYDAENRLSRTLDPEGGVVETFYDNEGRIAGTRRYANAGSAAAAPADAFAISVVPDNGRDQVSGYVYDSDGRLRVSVDGAGRPKEYLYDGAGNVLRSIDYAGIIAYVVGDSLDVVQNRIAALAALTDNRITRAVYDSANRQAYGIDATGQVTAFVYDGSGNLVKQVRYAGLFTAANDPSLSDMQVWAAGNANAADRVDRTFYDGASRVTFSVDAENYVSQFQYDAAGRVTKQIRHAGKTYSTGDGTTQAGLAAQIGAPLADAAVTAFTYDTAGRLTDTTDPENFVTHLVLDLLGQATDIIVAHNVPGDASTTRRVFDKAGRVQSETRAYGTTDSSATAYVYDGVGRVRFLTDARQVTTEYIYDGLGRCIQEVQPLAAGQSAHTYKQYDKFGNLVKLTDPRGNAALFHYDALDRLVWQTDPEGYVTKTAYTRGDQVASVTRYAVAVSGTTTAAPPAVTANAADATTTFTRDKLDRVKAVTDAENHAESYGLNSFGDRTSVTNKLNGTTVNTFDKRGLLLTESLPVGSTNALGTLLTANIVNKFEYDARGNRTKTIEAYLLPEQRTTIFGYDEADRLISKTGEAVYNYYSFIPAAGNWVVPVETYKYDGRGNLIETVAASGARTLSYHDDLNRKTAEVNALGTLSTWSYDANGNVAAARVYGNPVVLPQNAGGTAPGPVDPGNYRETSYTYDLNNRLFETKIAGLRTGKYQGGSYVTGTGPVILQNFYDAAGNLVHEVDGNGNSVYSFYDKAGRKIARVDQESYLTSYTLDGEGNTVTEERFSTKLASVDAASNPATLKAGVAGGAGNRITNFTYDRNGRRTSEARLAVDARSLSGTGALLQASGEAKIRYDYNGLGQVTKKTEANLDVTDFGYDAMGRQTSVESAPYTDFENAPVRRRTDTAYNGLDLATRSVDKGKTPAEDRVTTYTYSAGGRLDQLKDAAGTVYYHRYDTAGKLVLQAFFRANSAGVSTMYANAYRYDLLDRVTSQSVLAWQPSAVWEDRERTQFRYNVYGDVTGKGVNVVGDSYQEVFDYDPGGRLWRSNSGDGVWRFFVHDGAGNRTLTIESEGDGANIEGYALADAIAVANLGSGYGDGVVGTIAVFDRRGQQTSTVQPNRELSAAAGRVTLTSSRAYNAFGEVVSETDARGATTDFVYNTMGRMTEKHGAAVSYTPAAGVPVDNTRPVEKYYYDVSGRMIGLRDANSVQASSDDNYAAITRALLAGTGHDGTDALVTAEFHPDSGVFRTAYDIFGDARILRDELNEAETRAYDSMGRLTTQVHRGQLLTDHYRYDSLGQRIKHWNSHLGEAETETTDYDVQGRVTRQKTFGLAATDYTYNWNAGITTANLGTFGGWTRTTATGATSATEQVDLFGRVISRVDQNQRSYTFSYDKAGRLTAHTSAGGQSQASTYFNTGLVATIIDAAGIGSSLGGTANSITATYGYDESGNRTKEKYAGTVWNYDYLNGHSQEIVTFQDAVIGYDLLGRITSFIDQGNDRNFHTEYDLAGNVRRSREKYNNLAAGSGHLETEKWFTYDSMNRMVLANGTLVDGVIQRGDEGVALTYDVAGRRRTATHQQEMMGHAKAWVWVGTEGGHVALMPPLDAPPEGGAGWEEQNVDSSYSGARREEYTYRADGHLMNIKFADENYDGSGSYAEPTGVMRDPVIRGINARDAMGRVTSYQEYDDRLVYSYNRFGVAYDAASRVTDEVVTSAKFETSGYATYRSETHNDYFGPGGALSASTVKNFRGPSDLDAPDSATAYTYELWDEAKVKTITLDGVSTSTHYYDGLGRLTSVDIGARRHAVSFATSPTGQVLRRLEQSAHPYDPVDHYFYVDGQQVGEMTNNGDHDPARDDYSGVISTRSMKASTSDAPFRWNSYGPVTAGQFGGSGYDPVSPYSNGMQGHDERYSVRAGDTLASIAQQVWGDSSLWYMIAEANGLSGAEALVAGTSLIVPDRVTNLHNNSATFQVYDPNKAFGDLNPTTATTTSAQPPKKGNKCGVFGMILLVVIAVAVSVVTYGALAPQAAGFLTAVAAGAASGVAGSVVSQAFGVATGIQEKFSWKQVAMAGISGAVGGGVGNVLGQAGVAGSKILTGVVRGAAGSAITQGVAVATGLQKKFDWTAVAVAGVAGGVTSALTRYLPGGAREAGVNAAGEAVKAQAASHLNRFASDLGGAIAGAGVRSAITGTSFGDNVLAVLPSVIGSTIGNMIGGAINDALRRRPDDKAILAPEGRARLTHGIVELPDGRLRTTLLDGTVITGSAQEVYTALAGQAKAVMPPADRAVRSGNSDAAAATDGPAAGPTEFRYGDVFIPAATPDGTGFLYQYVGQNFVTGYSGAMAWGEYSEYYGGDGVGAGLAGELSLSPEATLAFAQMAEISAYMVGTHPTRQDALVRVADSLYAAHWNMTEPARALSTSIGNLIGNNSLSYGSWESSYRFTASSGSAPYQGDGSYITSARSGFGGWLDNMRGAAGYYGKQALIHVASSFFRNPGGGTMGFGAAAVEGVSNFGVNVVAEGARPLLPDNDDMFSAAARREAAARNPFGINLNPSNADKRLMLGNIAVGFGGGIARVPLGFARGAVQGAATRVRVFRVEGTPNARFDIDDVGNVALTPGDKTIWLNFGQDGRAVSYFDRKVADGLPEARLKSFEMDGRFLDEIRATAVPESLARRNPGAPIISRDPYPDQFGIRPDQFDKMMQSIYQGTGNNARRR